MSRFRLVWFFIASLVAIYTNPLSVYAQQNSQLLVIPSQPTLDSETRITIISDTSIFSTDQDYIFEAHKEGAESAGCLLYANNHNRNNSEYSSLLIADDKHATAAFNPSKLSTCTSGNWVFNFGKGTSYKNIDFIIPEAKNFSFMMLQKNAVNPPSISPANSPLQYTQTPIVLLSNAQVGTPYAFWWDGASDLAGPVFRPSVSGTQSIPLSLNGSNVVFNGGTTVNRKLCMAETDPVLGRTLSLSCTPYSTIFVFTTTPNPKGNIVCSPTQQSFSANDYAGILAKNLTKNGDYTLTVSNDKLESVANQKGSPSDDSGIYIYNLAQLPTGNYTARLYEGSLTDTNSKKCELPFSVGIAGNANNPGGGTNKVTRLSTTDCSLPANKDKCSSSAGQFCDATHLRTAIGCVPTDPVGLINGILSFSIGIAGGIALLLMMVGSFEMVTSQGDPKALQGGRERFVSALVGLLFILFSVVFLKIIGVDILGLDTITGGVFKF